MTSFKQILQKWKSLYGTWKPSLVVDEKSSYTQGTPSVNAPILILSPAGIRYGNSPLGVEVGSPVGVWYVLEFTFVGTVSSSHYNSYEELESSYFSCFNRDAVRNEVWQGTEVSDAEVSLSGEVLRGRWEVAHYVRRSRS